MTEMALLDAAPRPPGLRSRFVEGIGGLGLHVLEAGSSQTWAPGSPSPDPKWRLVTEVLGWGLVGAADQGGDLALLGDQTDQDQLVQVVRQGGGGGAEASLQPADRHALITGAHQCPIHLQASGVSQRFQLRGDFFDFHGNRVDRPSRIVNRCF